MQLGCPGSDGVGAIGKNGDGAEGLGGVPTYSSRRLIKQLRSAVIPLRDSIASINIASLTRYHQGTAGAAIATVYDRAASFGMTSLASNSSDVSIF
jgi:hypothetical protein